MQTLRVIELIAPPCLDFGQVAHDLFQAGRAHFDGVFGPAEGLGNAFIDEDFEEPALAFVGLLASQDNGFADADPVFE